MGKLVNKSELSEIIGKSEVTLTTYQKNGLPIKHAGGRGSHNIYDTAEVIAWLVRRELEKVVIGDDGEAIVYEVEKARLTKAQANHEELKVEVLKGDLIRSEVVERVQGGMVSAFRARCLSLPTKASPQLAGLDESAIEVALTDYIYEALEELSDFDPGAYIPQGSQAGEATTEVDDQPVGGQEQSPKQRSKRGTRTVAH